MTQAGVDLATRITAWQRTQGRHDLPWQLQREPYRVWLSEIMLQQTQVVTVMAYFQRFVDRFPSVHELASAHEDEVLGLWSGLGYYSRARNLHRCAQVVVQQWQGQFPQTAAQLQTLPGIGRSTAAAIAAFCFGERVAILDGNVKRVLSRVLGYAEDLANVAAERKLWGLAEDLLPNQRLAEEMPAYTQGVMDLGATVCTSRKPKCLLCPLNDLCAANRQGRPDEYPVRSRRIKRGTQALWLLWLQNAQTGAVWLHRRPQVGIWAGLHCLPVFESAEALESSWPQGMPWVHEPMVSHALTHKELLLHPVRLRWLEDWPLPDAGRWVSQDEWVALGLPAPVRRLLEQA